ncbi:hypothetical protein KHQ81_13630 [Mycoplasmatota bacterium]|nr:hypothetical protein KHQ81_13630 [Mycoplasmatota bacterium]
MKKIYGLLLLVALIFTLSSCGPNSNYYNLGSKGFYYYKDEPLVVDPYELFKENTDWLDISMSKAKKPQNYYNVTVEWRRNGTYDNFETLETVDNMIQFENPYKKVGTNVSYDFKLHFINKKDGNEKNMINYYGVFTFIKSPANPSKKVVNIKINTTYTLLKNVIEYNLEDKPMTPSELSNVYDISYTVKKDNANVAVTDGKVTFDEVGDYEVTIELTKKVAETDAVSSASQSGGDSEKMMLTINYTITVRE